jgi:DNA-binding transcriptional LysR family regulator
MAPIDLNLLRVFTALYQAGSFTGAARKLGVPRSTVSRAIAALEQQRGEQLVHRTTRTVSISSEGKQLFDRVAPLLDGLSAALADVPERRDEPAGTLKVTAVADLAAAVLAEAAVRFTARYPRTRVEMSLTPDVIDLGREGFDLALRIFRSRPPDSSLVARKIGMMTFPLYAAPSYLARRGSPSSEHELADHDWIGFRGVTPAPPARTRRQAAAPGRIVCDDVFVLRELIRLGGGIGALPSFLTGADLQAGSLTRVLPRYSLTGAAVYLVYPARKHPPSRVTAFRDLVLEIVRQRPVATAAATDDA